MGSFNSISSTKGPFNGNVPGGCQIHIFAWEKNLDPSLNSGENLDPPKLRGKNLDPPLRGESKSAIFTNHKKYKKTTNMHTMSIYK